MLKIRPPLGHARCASYSEKPAQVDGETKQYLEIVDSITGRLPHKDKDKDHLNLGGALQLEPSIRQPAGALERPLFMGCGCIWHFRTGSSRGTFVLMM